MVRKEGLEPSHPFGHRILNPARIPFRHFRTRAIWEFSEPVLHKGPDRKLIGTPLAYEVQRLSIAALGQHQVTPAGISPEHFVWSWVILWNGVESHMRPFPVPVSIAAKLAISQAITPK